MSEVLLGVDIGTSACKAAAFSPDGTVIAQANESYPVYYPQPGWAEQNPDEWWEAACRAIKKLLTNGVNASDVKGIGIDGQSWSAIAVDSSGRVLCNTPIWMDTRAKELCAELKATIGEERLFETSGNPLQPAYTLPKILWYRRFLPEVYAHTAKILQSNSFIAYRFTGVMTQEPSQGYGMNCYHIKSGRWDLPLCRDLGINPDYLPEIVPCHQVIGSVTAEAACQTGLLAGTPVVAGGLDAACGTLGAGVIHPGETQEQGGQAGGMSICMDVCKADQRLILGAHVVPERWLLQGGTVGGGGVVNWFGQEFGADERAAAARNGTNAFAELDRGAAKVRAGSDGLLFLPYMAGERSPIWNTNAKGVYYGVDYSKTRAHFSRASMEGVAYALRHNLDVAEQAGAPVQTLCAMGGAANSRLWTQIKADITGKRIVVPSSDTATALGAAILAGVGIGVYTDFEDAVSKTVRIKREHLPNPANFEIYEKGYQTYLKLYQNLKEIMNEA